MKTKINILFITFFFLLRIATAQTLFEHAQVWIDQPNNISTSNFTTFVDASNIAEGMLKINSIDPSTQTVGYSPTDFWPQGTWLHGYFERGDFWSDGFGNNCPQDNYNYPSGHPLFRINSKMLRSLIHANHANPGASWVADNIQTIGEGMDYMISNQWLILVPPAYMDDYGGFTWWGTRSGETAIDNESPFSNRPHAYETSHALRTMCEAYMYFSDNGITYSNMTGLYQAIVNAADNLERKTVQVGLPQNIHGDDASACDLSNSNYKGFAIWALAGAYKVTQDIRYFNKAKLLSDKLRDYQTSDGSIQDGMWLTGGCDNDGCGTFSNPNDTQDPCEDGIDQNTTDNNRIYHDTKIYYHCIILRGLVEMMDITPAAEVAWKISLIANIKKAVNHLINYRVAYYDDPSLGISRSMVRTTWTTIDGGTTCGIYTNVLSEEIMEPIAMLTLYSEYQSYFSCEERRILRNLLLTLGYGTQIYSTYTLENFVNYAYYADYFQAYENHQRIFPGFENNNFISPFAGITNYINHTVPPGVEIIEHANEIDFTNLLVPANSSLTVTSSVRIKCSPASSASSGSYFHAYIAPAECPGLTGKHGNGNYQDEQITVTEDETPDSLTLSATPNPKQQTVTTEWTATALSAFDYFTVERSNHPPAPSLFKDGEGFSIVITVPGKGGVGETLQYEEVDKDPLYGISYYRVKQNYGNIETPNLGVSTYPYRYSNIATVKLLPPLAFSVRPNPARHFIEVTFGKIEKGTVYVLTPEYDARIFIFTASGQQVFEKSFNGTFYKYSIDVSDFSQGLYFVTLIANDQLYKGKFVKE